MKVDYLAITIASALTLAACGSSNSNMPNHHAAAGTSYEGNAIDTTNSNTPAPASHNDSASSSNHSDDSTAPASHNVAVPIRKNDSSSGTPQEVVPPVSPQEPDNGNTTGNAVGQKDPIYSDGNQKDPGYSDGNTAASFVKHSTANADVSGYVVEILHNGQKTPIFAAGSNINSVIIDGKTYTIENIEEGGTPATRYSYNVIGNDPTNPRNHLRYARSGYFETDSKSSTKDYFVFYQGIATEDMPQTGTVQYSGSAIHDIKSTNEQRINSNFTANFAEKTLNGTISGNNVNITLNSYIKGNTFYGKGTKGNIITHGRFYGPAAAELAGLYRNDDGSLNGSFGASKAK